MVKINEETKQEELKQNIIEVKQEIQRKPISVTETCFCEKKKLFLYQKTISGKVSVRNGSFCYL